MIWRLEAAAIAPALVSSATGATGASLCEDRETTIFSCVLKGSAQKQVGLCADKELTAKGGRLAYRFGAPGRIELAVEQDRAAGPAKFSFSHYFRARFDETKVIFSNKGYEYSIRESYDAEARPQQSAGVDVSAPDGKFQTLDCSSNWTSKLQTLETVLPQNCSAGGC